MSQGVIAANEFILHNFEAFTATAEFNEISKERICSYLSDDQVRLSNGEIEVFRAAAKWIENNSRDANLDIEEIIKHVRFPLMPVDLLLDEVMYHSFIELIDETKNMVK